MQYKRKVYREGMRFGKLVALEYLKVKKYRCLCDCGKEKTFNTSALLSRNALSCGCIDSIHRENYDEDMKKKLLESIKLNENGCWIWQKSKHKQGYGNFPYKRKVILAHRASWMLFKGNLDKDILVCHSCDNPPCCNPDHLFLGTDKDNSIDAWSKGRIPRSKGENHYFSKYTEKDVLKIRELSLKGYTQYKLAEMFDMSRPNIAKIVNRQTWKHV